MTTIYLIRHAEADGNLYRRAHGWYDSVITDRGYRQIAALAKRFASTHFDAVYSSDRRRTMTTALSVYKTHGLPLVTTPRVREIGIGVWEDHPWAELERTDGEQLERFNTDAAHWHVAGGEYLPDVRERMIGALREIAEAHPNGTAAVFSHGMAIRLTVGFDLSGAERTLLEKYRSLSPIGRDTVRSVTDALCDYRDELTEERGGKREPRLIPLYNSPAAAGYAAPVLDEDFTYIPADESVPRGADFAVRIQGDSMEPYIHDKSVVYVNRDPLADGDVGIFCVDGAMLCKQYHRDALGMTYLFSLNRARADADVVLTSTGTRSLACFGRVMLPHRLAVPQL